MGSRLAPILLLATILGLSQFRPALVVADGKKGAADAGGKTGSFSQQMAPLLAKYCVTCHGGAKPKARLAFDAFKDDASALKDPEVWEKVGKKLRAGEMPPEKRPRPTKPEVQQIVSWIDTKLAQLNAKNTKDPGRVTLRRLNRVEYNNTIRDLVGIDFHPADDFPSDDVGYGFDNIGDVLSMAPILMEKYVDAAERIVDKAW